MERKSLGDTGELIPEVGLGTWRYQGDAAVIHRALDLGGNLIDTAEAYLTEDKIGEAIAGNRDAYFIATKVSGENLRTGDVIKACEESLRLLGTEVIDLYQVHWPNEKIPIAETMEGMARLLRDGKIRHVGVSNFSVAQMREADDALRSQSVGHGIVANQVAYSLFTRGIEDELLPYCEEHSVTVIGYSPLEQGRMDAELRNNSRAAEAIRSVTAETGKTQAQVLINWAVHSAWAITIPQTNRVERVDEDLGASGWRLTEAQYAALSASTA